jgi:type I restriction enzyme M protein
MPVPARRGRYVKMSLRLQPDSSEPRTEATVHPNQADALLDKVFGDPNVKHGLALYSDAERHSLPLMVKNGRTYLKCLVTAREKLARPEEVVRQLELARVRDVLNYNLDRVGVEVRIRMGSTYASKAADIVVFDDKTKSTPHIIIEVKKPQRQDGMSQLHSYMNATGVYYGEWSNGVFRTAQLRSDPNTFETIPRLPAVDETLDDIKKPLTKTDLVGLQDLKDEVQYLENSVLANAGVSTFDEIFKLVFAKLYDESEKADHEALDFRVTTERPERQYAKLNSLFLTACNGWPGIFGENENIELTPQALVTVASEFQDKRFFGADLDVIDAAFEYLINPDQKGDKGQYFTPRSVVKMCVKMMNPGLRERVLDPACGPGGFLVHSLNWVTQRELLRRFPQQLDRKKIEYATGRLFGIDFDSRLVRVARALMLIAGDGRSNIYKVSSLDSREWRGRGDGLVSAIRDGKFDLIMTNPPFAGSIRIPEVLGEYDLAYKGQPSRNRRASSMTRDALFVERCMRFLKPGGRMAIVLPQGNLNNVGTEYLRTWLRRQGRLLAVVGLSGNTFKKFTNTKTSVLFVQKWRTKAEQTDDYNVFMAVNRKPVKDTSGRYLYKMLPDGTFERDSEGNKLIDHDLDEIADAFVSWAKAENLEFWS